MHTLARPLVRENRLQLQSGSRAFTLIELLTVIGIIAILSAITFGIIKGVNERAANDQAKAELGLLGQALDNYKRQYGDYPQVPIDSAGTTGATSLFKALNGSVGPKLNTLSPRGRVFVEKTKLTLFTPTAADDADNYFVDPWGRAYRYAYKGPGWTNTTYILYSVGGDGETTDIPASGIITDAYLATTKTVSGKNVTVNVDNLLSSK